MMWRFGRLDTLSAGTRIGPDVQERAYALTPTNPFSQDSTGRLRLINGLAYAAFAFVLISEVLGRYLFCASFVRIGI